MTLELGGKTGFMVFADADLERAADALVFSAFNNAGQTCTATSSKTLLVAGAPDSASHVAAPTNCSDEAVGITRTE